MKISNLRIERRNGWSYLTVDVKAKYTDNNVLWYAMPSEYENWFSDDVYDAFLVSALYPAMYHNEDIEIAGNVSEELFCNIVNEIEDICLSYRKKLHKVSVRVKGFSDAIQSGQQVGTGFSAGVDSFSTFIDHYEREKLPNRKITALFFFNVGSHGGGGVEAHEVFDKRYELLKEFPLRKGLPYVKLDSNLFDFYLKYWEYDAGIFCRAAAILTLQREFSRYYLSSTHSYAEWMRGPFDCDHIDLASVAEGFLNPLLSTEKLRISLDGSQYLRTDKMRRIVAFSYVKEYLNVCVDPWHEGYSANNCSVCSKCLRTLIAIEAMGLLNEYAQVFDIAKYKLASHRYKCEIVLKARHDQYMRDNLNFALEQGLSMPSKWQAKWDLIIRPFLILVIKWPMMYSLGCCIKVFRRIFGERLYQTCKKRIKVWR